MKRGDLSVGTPVRFRLGGWNSGTVVRVRARNRFLAEGEPDRVEVLDERGRTLFLSPRQLFPAKAAS